MTFRTLICNSLRHHWRSHLGVVLGAAVGSAALIGALIVGDSVRESLRQQALGRLGWVEAALDGGDHFFPQKLAERVVPINRAVPSALNSWNFDAVLKLPGTASRQDGTARANQVNVLGVGYWSFWQSNRNTNARPAFALIPKGSVVLNEPLAAQLHARPGDEVVLRLHKPTALSRDVPITPQSDASVALRLKVHGIATAPYLGNFSLRAGPTPPLNAFLLINDLAPAAGLPAKANLILAGDFRTHGTPFASRLELWWWRIRAHLPGYRPVSRMVRSSETKLTDWKLAWQPSLADYSLSLRILTNQTMLELHSDRIFLEPAVEAAILSPITSRSPSHEVPSWAVTWGTAQPPRTNTASRQLVASLARPVLTYLVNQLRSGTNAAPYSMVTAARGPWTPPDMRDDEILVNQWLADDLRLQPGDPLDLTYFLAESGARLVERTNRFRVRAVVPMTGLHADRTLMPEFPGLAKAESTHEWDAGFPLKHKIRDQDERYWKNYRGTPKAFVTLRAGQAMWGNRFGQLTSIRFPVPADETPGAFLKKLEDTLAPQFDPASFGLRFEPVRKQALAAANQSQDFGGLFIGFSFFLIAAALILMGLLFQFGMEQRAAEVGTLLALGFTPKQVRRLFLLEGAALALAGGVIGALGGIGYAWLMLRGLTTIWRDAIGAPALAFHLTPLTLGIGLVSAVVISALTVWVVLRKQARRPARELLAGEGGEAASAKSEGGSRGAWSALGCLVCVAGLVVWALLKGETANPEVFFSAGTLCLIGGLALVSWWLGRAGFGGATSLSPQARGRDDKDVAAPFTLASLGVRGCTRRRKRSLAVAALLASGVFLIASIGVFRLDANADAQQRSSGTGGFALIGQSAMPVTKDLNTPEGRDFFGLDEKEFSGVSFVPLRVRDGDDASCLNLNHAQKPRLLGVRPESLAGRGAFTFAKVGQASRLSQTASGAENSAERPADSKPSAPPRTGGTPVLLSPWMLLRKDQSLLTSATNEIPAIGDAASIQWALGKSVGDMLDYTDERGRTFKLRLVGAVANSILQGNLIIDEAEFVKRFPSESGYRMFLIDAPTNRVAQVSAALSRGLQDVGLELTPSARRLAQFNAVQNTYLNTFQVLGGLGLLLGSAGLGVVVLRNVLERRAELALLLAVGFRRRQLHWLVLGEHGALLGLGLAVGLGSAAVAVLPALLSPAAELPLRSLGVTLAAVCMVGLIATWGAAWLALRGPLLEGLRSE